MKQRYIHRRPAGIVIAEQCTGELLPGMHKLPGSLRASECIGFVVLPPPRAGTAKVGVGDWVFYNEQGEPDGVLDDQNFVRCFEPEQK